MVLDPHAESVDEDGDHDPPVKVFALHDSLQFLPELHPCPKRSVLVLQSPMSPAPTSPAPQIASLKVQTEEPSHRCNFHPLCSALRVFAIHNDLGEVMQSVAFSLATLRVAQLQLQGLQAAGTQRAAQ